MQFKQLYSHEMPSYDSLVDESREGTIFHKSWWFDSFKDDHSRNANRVLFYGAYDQDELVAGFPIPYRDLFFLRIIVNPKLTAYLGAIYKKEPLYKTYKKNSYIKNINRGFAKILARQGICLHYPFNTCNVDVQPFIWSNFKVSVYYTYILPIVELNGILANMEKKRRNDIKNISKTNYTIKLGDLDSFIRLHEHSLRRKNNKHIPDETWKNVHKVCKKHRACEIFTLFRDGQPRSSLFLVWDNKRSYYLGGGINDECHGDMSLLVWEAIKYTKEKLGLDEFDFEGSMVPGIESYFRKFGGTIVPRYVIKNRMLYLLNNIF